MRARLWIVLAASPFLAGWDDRNPQWPHVGAMPDDPAIAAPSRYKSITAGTKSYRPVDPLPWGDINRGVAPPGTLGPLPKNGKGVPPEQSPPQHKH